MLSAAYWPKTTTLVELGHQIASEPQPSVQADTLRTLQLVDG